MHMHMPVLNPATVQEYLDFGLAGWALSRFVVLVGRDDLPQRHRGLGGDRRRRSVAAGADRPAG